MARPAARKGDIADHKKAPPGPILEGSANVLINGLPAARMGDPVQHKKSEEPIVQGSSSVFINGKPAARVTDKVACWGEIAEGSPNVFIGDGADGRACSACPGATKVGSPVNPLLGAKVLDGPDDLDFALPGPLPLVWQRHYSSYVGPSGTPPSLLGPGWRLPFEMHLTLDDEATVLHDTKNRAIRFEPIAPGEIKHSVSEGFWLLRGGAPHNAEAGAGWQSDPRWSHIPTPWQQDPHYLMAATADRTVWLFAAGDRQPTGQTPWLLIALRDVLGRQQWLERNLNQRRDLPHGQLLAITDGAGRRYELDYTHIGSHQTTATLRLKQVKLPGHARPLARYSYNAQGELTQVTDRHGRAVREFEYDHHRISAHRALGGPWARYTYESDAPGARVIHHGIEHGLSYQFNYQDQQTVVTDSLGRRTVYSFTGQGGRQRLSALTDALGGITLYHHSLEGQLVQQVDPLGRITSLQRDAQGQLTRVVLPDGSSTQQQWDSASGQLLGSTDAGGSATHFQYDSYGRLTQHTDALGHSTEYRYADPADAKDRHSAEHPRQIIDAKGGTKHLAWSATGQLLSYTDCSGQTTHYRYDTWGNVSSVTNALGERVSYHYNALQQLERLTQPDGSQTHYRYNAQGHLVSVIDAQGGHTQHQRDAHGRIVQTTTVGPPNHTDSQPPGQTRLAYRYDVTGRLIELTNENGAVTTFTYDALDRLVTEVGFDGRSQRFEYDGAGQLTAHHDSASAQPDAPTHSTFYRYDAAGRVIERRTVTHPGTAHLPSEEVHRFEYDKAGQLIAAHSPQAQVRFERDALGRIEAESLRCLEDTGGSAGQTAFFHSLRHQHDALGHRIGSEQPFVGDLSYLSYGSGHVHQIALEHTPLIDIERDALHREVQRIHHLAHRPALQVHRQWDSMGRLRDLRLDFAQAHEPRVGGLSRHYGYDAIGQLTSVTRPGLRETRYAYDHAHRLVHASQWQNHPPVNNALLRDKPSELLGSQHWAFDPAGNRLPGERSPARLDNRLGDDTQRRCTHDAWGNVNRIEHIAGARAGQRVLLLHDAQHRLGISQRFVQQDGRDEWCITTRYRYDALGRRIGRRRVREHRDGRTPEHEQHWFGWDGDRLVTEQSHERVISTVYEPNSFVPLFRVDTTREQGPSGPSAKKSLYFFHTNHLGTPEALIDQHSGQIVWQAELDPWGNTLSEHDPLLITRRCVVCGGR